MITVRLRDVFSNVKHTIIFSKYAETGKCFD